MSAMQLVGQALVAAAFFSTFGAQMLRWLRVLQREHYEPSSMITFLGRWSTPQVASAKATRSTRDKRPFTLSHALLVALVLGVVFSSTIIVVAVSLLYGFTCPQGLSIKGRTSKLQWTRRLRTVAVLATVLAVAVSSLGALIGQHWLFAAIVVWAVPMLLDISTRILAPLEERNAKKFVDQAVKRLARVQPLVVGITGSYGKTSTKNHLFDILSADGGVVASPRSFNNRAGLSRAVNENLTDDARVFIAEMGTYGPGEIAELCRWCPPEISVVTAIGPVHLERMKSLDVINEAKFEITGPAKTVVLNIDDPRLAQWPERLLAQGKKVRTAASANENADVRVTVVGDEFDVVVDGESLGRCPKVPGVQATNVACAVAAALELGAMKKEILTRLSRLHAVANRANVVMAPSGVLVIDDTFNANPASAASALSMLVKLEVTGSMVLVTPGLIELGDQQYPENLKLARDCAAFGVQLVIVGRTNARALENGYQGDVRRFDTRDQAVAWVRETLQEHDAVLYLNDLPDHYP